MALKKIRNRVLNNQGTTDIIHYESSADIIVVKPVEGKITKNNVQEALEELAAIAASGGVTSVNGKDGAVVLSPEDIGAEPVFAKNTAFNKNFGTAADTVMEGNDTRVLTAVSDINTIKGQITTITEKNTEQDNTISTVSSRADAAYTLAEGRARAVSFETYETLVASLKSANKTDYKVGDNLFIVATDVPDYWISAVLEDNTGTTGYFTISPLESQKVDLSEYQKQTDNSLTTTSKTVVGAINEVKETADTALGKANTNETDISNIKNGTTAVGKATNADNATNVTGQINGKGLDSIFEADGITVKQASNAASANEADKLSAVATISISGAVSGSTTTDFSTDTSIVTSLGDKVVSTNNIADGAVNSDKMANSGVTAGTWSAVAVNSKGIVTKGAQMIEYGANIGDTIPSSTLAIGGFFLELLAVEE